MELIFLKTIRDEPNREIHRLIYADWLEEQGHSKAELVRLWCQATGEEREPRSEARCILRSRFETLHDLFPRLNKPQRRRLACDYAQRVLPWLDQFGPFQLEHVLETSRQFAAREITHWAMAGVVHTVREMQTYPIQVVNGLSAVLAAVQGQPNGAAYAARLILGETAEVHRLYRPPGAAIEYFRLNGFFPEYQRQYLMALSYHLFDCNCLLTVDHPVSA